MSLIKLLWIVITVLIIDFGSKLLILHNFSIGETVSLSPLLSLNYVRNYGAAFSFLSENKGWQKWFLIGITISICIVLLLMIFNAKKSQNPNNIAYSLILGGSLGNLLDRIWHGFVVDMIDFHIKNWHFATFNFADSAICTGVILIILGTFSKID